MNIILASASPRRKQLLEQVGCTFQVIPSTKEEPKLDHLPPHEGVMLLARQKAEDTANTIQSGIVIGADTIVATGRHILGKPRDEEEAFAMLSKLQGKRHDVYTGICVIRQPEGKTITEYEKTAVYFAPMSREEILGYIATGEPMDKAGAYGIQGYGAVYIQKVEGCYFNVMGLPLHRLHGMLKNMGYDVTGKCFR